jgi:glycosyltransferase involved in cell wall biosynthesis
VQLHVFTRAMDEHGGHEIVDGVHLHKCPIYTDSDLPTECNNMCNSFVHFVRETEAHMNYEFDIIHCHDWLAAKALVQMKQAGRRCILTMHSTEYGRNGNKHSDAEISGRIRAIEQEGCDYADRVICVSGRLCDEVKSFGCDHKLRMVYNGVQLHHFEGLIDAAYFKGQYGIMPLQPMILFCGRMNVQKGLINLPSPSKRHHAAPAQKVETFLDVHAAAAHERPERSFNLCPRLKRIDPTGCVRISSSP